MAASFTIERFERFRGADVYDRNGERIGKLEELYVDRESQQPEWLGIGTGFLGMKRQVVPAVNAETQGSDVQVPYDADLVKDSPGIDDDRISDDVDRSLHSHYSVPQDGGSTSGTQGEATVTRSEEQLRIGKERTGAGHVELHKRVETEPVQADVTLERERATIHREPVDEEAGRGAEIGERDVAIDLEEERAIVEKETVPKEQVSVATDTTEETAKVRDTLRREVVEVEGDVDEERR